MHIAMVGPELDARGGIASVARALLDATPLAHHRLDYVPTMRDGSGARKALGMARRQAAFVARIAGGWRPDLFHIHLSYFTSFYRKLAYFEEARATGAPVVVHVHAPDLNAFHAAGRAHAAAIRHVFTRADCVVALSEDMARTIHRLAGPGVNVQVVYNPVVLPPPRSGPLPTDPPTVLFLGELGQRKGTWDLVACIPEILKQVPAARFVFGGNGDQERLKDEIAALGVRYAVEVLGWVSGADKTAAINRATLLTLPSYQEGLPMSILEAMGAGLPVVSTTIAGIPEAVIANQTGLLHAPGDQSALCAHLCELLRDPAAATRMGRNARTRAEEVFSLSVVAEHLNEVWEAVMSNPEGGTR